VDGRMIFGGSGHYYQITKDFCFLLGSLIPD